MSRSFRVFVAALVLALGALPAGAALPVEILPVDQIKAGMKGTGRTVFSGIEIEEFEVEILGVLSNTTPRRKVILARLKGRNLEQTGVIQGMSGSPVYIDGRLIGAVAFSFAFAKEPIAGITPIEEMLAVAGSPARASSPSPARLPLSDRVGLDELLAAYRDIFSPPPVFNADGRVGAPLPMPLIFGGFSPRVMERASPLFAGLGFRPVMAPSAVSGQRAGASLTPDLVVREGDPLAIQLVTGDFDVSAVGTATHVDGVRVYAFGHPLYNLGSVDYGMAKASIIAVVPSMDSSFKLGAVGSPLGAIVQDRTAGAYGEIGRTPKLVPVNLTLSPDSGPSREFRFRIASDKLLTPLLLNMSIASVLDSESRSLGDLTLELRGDVYLDTTPGLSVRIEDMFSGNLGSAVSDLSGLVTAVTYFLANNEFREVGLHRIDLNIRTSEIPRTTLLERVRLDKYEVSPGESVLAELFLKDYRGETRVERVPFQAPHLPAGSEFQFVVADTRSLQQVELGQYRAGGIVPRSLDMLVRLLNNLRKGNRIYFKLIGPRPGLFLRGEEMPNLPPSMKSLFSSPRSATPAPTETTVSTLSEYQMPVPFVFQGLAVVPLKIRK